MKKPGLSARWRVQNAAINALVATESRCVSTSQIVEWSHTQQWGEHPQAGVINATASLLLISASFQGPYDPATGLHASLVPPLADWLGAAL
jgi:hypothetical protein